MHNARGRKYTSIRSSFIIPVIPVPYTTKSNIKPPLYFSTTLFNAPNSQTHTRHTAYNTTGYMTNFVGNANASLCTDVVAVVVVVSVAPDPFATPAPPSEATWDVLVLAGSDVIVVVGPVPAFLSL